MEAAFAQHELPGDIAEVQDLWHAVAHGSLVDNVHVAVVGIAVVAEALLQSMAGPGNGYRSQYRICWVFSRSHLPLVQAPRSWKYWLTLGHFHLALLAAEVLESAAHAFL